MQPYNPIKPSRGGDCSLAPQGFTLIEVSIVLVVIGLFIGGILVGQSLIKAAKIRATLSQITRLNTAVNTFHDKFNGLPGDIANYAGLGLAMPSDNEGLGPNADNVGNGFIEDDSYFGYLLDGEISAFLVDLSLAQMLDKNNIMQFAGNTTSGFDNISQFLIPSAYGNGTFMWATWGFCGGWEDQSALPVSINQYNYWHIAGVDYIDQSAQIFQTLAISPVDAAGIDRKIDDGVPDTGKVLAHNAISGCLALYGGECVPVPGVYGVVAHPNAGACNLAIQAGF